jgi:hypothetical protein
MVLSRLVEIEWCCWMEIEWFLIVSFNGDYEMMVMVVYRDGDEWIGGGVGGAHCISIYAFLIFFSPPLSLWFLPSIYRPKGWIFYSLVKNKVRFFMLLWLRNWFCRYEKERKWLNFLMKCEWVKIFDWVWDEKWMLKTEKKERASNVAVACSFFVFVFFCMFFTFYYY